MLLSLAIENKFGCVDNLRGIFKFNTVDNFNERIIQVKV